MHTSSTISIPPCNHLWLLSLFWYQTSSPLMTRSAPSFLPSSLKTIQARAIFPSSDPRSGIIPATIASAMSPRGSLSSTSSTWKGDTWRPSGVLNVSLTLPTMLQEEIHWATIAMDQTKESKSTYEKRSFWSTRTKSPVRIQPSTNASRVAFSSFQ